MEGERTVKKGLVENKKNFSIFDRAVAAEAKSFLNIEKVQLNPT